MRVTALCWQRQVFWLHLETGAVIAWKTWRWDHAGAGASKTLSQIFPPKFYLVLGYKQTQQKEKNPNLSDISSGLIQLDMAQDFSKIRQIFGTKQEQGHYQGFLWTQLSSEREIFLNSKTFLTKSEGSKAERRGHIPSTELFMFSERWWNRISRNISLIFQTQAEFSNDKTLFVLCSSNVKVSYFERVGCLCVMSTRHAGCVLTLMAPLEGKYKEFDNETQFPGYYGRILQV